MKITYIITLIILFIPQIAFLQTSETDEILLIVEKSPRFPGCEHLDINQKEKEECAQKKMLEYIYGNLKYPEIARRNGIEGQVVVQFVINKKGLLEDITLVRDLEGGCGEEVLRLVNGMKEPWEPGVQDGLTVKVKYTLPIKFKLEGDKKNFWQRLFGL